MDWDSFYDERTLFLIENKLNYAVDQQGFSSGVLQIQESMLMNNFVTAHQQPTQATNIPKDENVTREEATQAFKTRVTNLLKTPKTELHDAIRALKEMTTFLGKNAEPLSLFEDTPDKPDVQQQNRELWRLLNICWLTVFQRQIESTRNVRRLTVDELEGMGGFLIHFCDGIERHGLVDYEMGVWEEEILDLITRCIEEYQSAKVAGSDPSKPLF